MTFRPRAPKKMNFQASSKVEKAIFDLTQIVIFWLNFIIFQLLISRLFCKLFEICKNLKWSSGTQLPDGTNHMGSGIIQYDPTMIIRQSIRKSGILQSEGNPLRKETENDLGGTVGPLTGSGKLLWWSWGWGWSYPYSKTKHHSL